MDAIPISVALVSFAVPAVAYTIVTGLLAVSVSRSSQGRWLLLASAGSATWGIALFGLIFATGELSGWAIAIDAAHLMFWVLFLASLLSNSSVAAARRMARLFSVAALVMTAGVVAAVMLTQAGAASTQTSFVVMLTLACTGLLGLEQLFRNSSYEQRAFLKLIAVAIGWIFVFNLFVYSQAILFSAISPLIWSLRGIGTAAVAPLILLAIKRHADWGEELFVSRQVVFYTTSLTAAGFYLLAMAVGGYVIGVQGLTWGPALQATFFVLAGGVLVYALFSRAMRARFRVFLAKHFYRNRYDYREEWLKLVETLAGHDSRLPLRDRAVRALADVIGSPAGVLWFLGRDSDRLEPHGSWNLELPVESLAPGDPLVAYMQSTRWVVDTEEYRDDPEKYQNAFANSPEILATPSVFVPLIHGGGLVGIVRLERPAGLGRLGFEDHDLLKTSGQQVAIFLIQERDREALAETRQFEAFSRLTAFMMHDLKNLIAQQELVVGNARRYKHRPEFVDDAIGTMDAGVRRMRRLLDRLRTSQQPEAAARVEVAKLLYETASACADRKPEPRVVTPGAGAADDAVKAWVSIDRERLGMAVTHAIRNAQDATQADGFVEIRLRRHRETAVIEIADDGCGMEEAFIRDHLFKPFDSTKGAQGMGIGAYQIRETVRSAGGELRVVSRPGEGTVVSIILPLTGELDSSVSHSAA